MKERPILFTPEMAKAVNERRKTQTRRVMKKNIPIDAYYDQDETLILIDKDGVDLCDLVYADWYSPYGNKGDRLWVRETWAVNKSYDTISPSMAKIAMGVDYYGMVRYLAEPDEKGTFPGWVGRWRPSIHMPREFSRLNLDIKRVWAERVQDISEGDALAEGIIEESFYPDDGFPLSRGYTCEFEKVRLDQVRVMRTTARSAFRELWDSINGEPRPDGTDISWEANPWVWCIEFEVAQ